MNEHSFFGSDARFDHIGLAVSSIRDATPDCDARVNETEGVLVGFIDLHGIRIELLEPLDDQSPIARSVRDGVKLLHLCYEVPDLEEALEECRGAGFHRISCPATTPILGNRRTVWVFSRQYGLFELLERDCTT